MKRVPYYEFLALNRPLTGETASQAAVVVHPRGDNGDEVRQPGRVTATWP
jgi:hypothetical protein